jgi:hypothetical protein
MRIFVCDSTLVQHLVHGSTYPRMRMKARWTLRVNLEIYCAVLNWCLLAYFQATKLK